MAKSATYLEFQDSKSQKFWEITVEGSSHTVRYGRLGTKGQIRTKTFESAAAARKDADRLIKSKRKKGYREPVASFSSGAASSEMRTLVEDVIEAMSATVTEREEDPEMRERMMPTARPPARPEELVELEQAWGRPLPPSYRDFLLVANGIERAQGTHLFLGTDDQLSSWADEQIDDISEYWNEEDDDPFRRDLVLPLLVPEAGMGIRNFLGFHKSDAEEMLIVDWDNGASHAEYKSVTHVLEHFLELEYSVQASHGAEREARLSEEEVIAALVGETAIPAAPEARSQTLQRFREVDDVPTIRRAVQTLASANLSSSDMMVELFGGSHPNVGSEAWLERMELLFLVEIPREGEFFTSWVRELNNVLMRAFTANASMLERWADVARGYVRDNVYLGHNLACAYVRAGRVDDAYAMCQAAAEVEYPQLRSMRTDSDLGVLLEQERFLALFPAADESPRGRVEIPTMPDGPANLDVAEGVEKLGQWLSEQGHPLGEVVLADLEAEAEPKKKRKAKNRAKKVWQAYLQSTLAPAFPLIAKNFTHFLEGEYYCSFRYGFLELLDTFQLRSAEERQEALALVADPHARFARRIALRGAVLDDLEMFRGLRALERLNFRWTDITQVRSLEPLAEHRQLRALNISNSAIADLAPIAKAPMIQLYAERTEVTNLSCLAHHPTLSNINLGETQVKDIAPLLTIPHLCLIGLWDTPLSEEEVEPLQDHVKGREPVHHDAIMDGIDEWVSHRQKGASDA